MSHLELRGRRFDAGHPGVMAIVNRTPDSFFPGNRHTDTRAALDAVAVALEAGADIVDVGAVRAGQEGEQVSAETEIGRLMPFLQEVRRAHPDVILSLDTWRSEVVLAVADVGIDLVNDTWAGHDPELVAVAARIGAGVVCSHTGGLPPRTDPVAVSYEPEPDGVVQDVLEGLRASAAMALEAGVPADRILLDPTLDFGGETLDLPVEDRLFGSLAATAVAAWLGAAVFRTHDVRATRQTLDMVASIRGDRPPARAVRGEPDAC